MRRGTDGWRAGIGSFGNLGRFHPLYLGRETGRDSYSNATVGEDGHLVLTDAPFGIEVPPTLYLPLGADVALAEALADRSPDAEWKARAEERQTALDREVARVDRIIGGAS